VKRVIGKKAGNLVFFLDALKGFVAAGWPFVAGALGASFLAGANGESARDTVTLMQLAGFFGALIGHCFSVFLKFKGGKGVAVTIGALLGAMPLNMACGGLVWAALFFGTRYVSVASVGMALALPVIAYALPGQGVGPHFFFSLFVAVFIVYTHRANLGRLMKGEESRFTKKPTRSVEGGGR
jgi:glycerol-3-phosphate acyltransferase PlsY